jgi:RNAse (barnase) inhibitor barstar
MKTITKKAATDNAPFGEKTKPVLSIDYDLYDQYLQDAELSDEERREFLDALWSIIVQFVDLGFGVHPLQQLGDQNAETSSWALENLLSLKNAPAIELQSSACGSLSENQEA